MANLLDAVVVSNMAINKGFDSVTAAVTDASTQADGDAANHAITGKCTTADADVQDAGAQVSEVLVLPWNLSLRKAQDAYLANNTAWQDKFTACAENASRWSDGSAFARIIASSRIAHRAFINALPTGDGNDRNRVEALFKD
jgi:hypothetical protein